jgi:N,N'-diacetylchitobiose phosphorylase
MVNGWLPYQNLSCRIWARSAYYQSGGAFGFRDQLQDASAFVLQDPELTRRQILLHAQHQFPEGDVLHWWHPPASRGLRTRFADDLLWLPYLATEYASTMGDEAIWDESIGFVTADPLTEGEDERFVETGVASETASLLEHCCRAIDRSLDVGAHQLPLMGGGDWNDGMNRVGVGRGESVWMGFFLLDVLQRMLPIVARRGDPQRLTNYTAALENLKRAVNDAGWDGAWYRRAFYGDGTPIGSSANDECKIDALVQAWSVLSGAAPPARAKMAMDAVEEYLVDNEHALIRLLWPPLDKTDHDPGYIKGYLAGIRENGGQYTHGILWFIRAMAELGHGSRSVELLRMISPISHTRTRDQLSVYQTEPYAVVADIYSVSPHEGRGGWSWYTGSAGWMFRVAVESILGLSIVDGKQLRIRPSISAEWPTCRLAYQLPQCKTRYVVTIRNPNGQQSGVQSAQCDGRSLKIDDGAAIIDIENDGCQHDVQVHL